MKRFKSFLRTERIKLKEMNAQEKRWYIWEYYKAHIIAALIILFLVGGLVDAWVINKSKKNYYHIAWMASFQATDELALLSQVLTDAMVQDKDREEVLISSYVLSEKDVMYNSAIRQRLSVMLAGGEIHAFIVEDADDVERLAQIATIRTMDDALAHLEELDEELYKQVSLHRIIIDGEDTPDDIKGGFYAVSLEGSSLMKSLQIPTDNLYICKVVDLSHDFETAQALQVLYEE